MLHSCKGNGEFKEVDVVCNVLFYVNIKMLSIGKNIKAVCYKSIINLPIVLISIVQEPDIRC